MSNKAIMLCVPVAGVQEWLGIIKSGETNITIERKNMPNVNSAIKIYLYCVKDGLVTTTDEKGIELWVRGNAVGKDGQFYNGKVFGECELYAKMWDNGRFYWHTIKNTAYAKPKPIWAFKQYGKDKPMYRAISDWCYVEELEDDKV